ncbi:hypothetical protein [Marinicella gelatinilytica]|uniref:hypothetical protein n=1 Tax=Marinicella gelatinilytica TaxID=2996017 RepID=UPI0022609B04|nr:hypothetical protein [Marinicella gelatinilytica]MCX7546255.1 hypothetical protein [Marinicella gelatinilytica]
MPKMDLNEFRAAVKTKLRERVNNKCSNVNCRITTLGPSETHNITNIGEAAHIHGAKRGSARWVKDMTPEQRRDYDNGIWLCSGCHKKIDRDENRYPVKVLLRWKQDAEAEALNEIGKKSFTSADQEKFVSSFVTGNNPDIPLNKLAKAVDNVFRGGANVITSAMEELDPRVRVIPIGGLNGVTYEIHPKEPFGLSLMFTLNDNSHLEMDEYIKHGKPVEIPLSSINVDGSELFKQLFDNEGKLFLQSPSPQGSEVIILFDETYQEKYFGTVKGNWQVGTETATFHGVGMGGMLSHIRVIQENTTATNFTFTLNFEAWEGKSIQQLNGFNKLFEFYSCLINQKRMKVISEIEGLDPIEAISDDIGNIPGLKNIYDLICFIDKARKLTKFLKIDVSFCFDKLPRTNEEYLAVIRCAEIIDTILIKGTEKRNSNISFEIIPEIGNKSIIEDIGSGKELNFIVNENKTIEIFGKTVQIPEIIYELHKFVLAVDEGDSFEINEGEKVKIKMIPSKSSVTKISYK